MLTDTPPDAAALAADLREREVQSRGHAANWRTEEPSHAAFLRLADFFRDCAAALAALAEENRNLRTARDNLVASGQAREVDVARLTEERDKLKAGERVVKEFLVKIFANAIAGLSDAALISQKVYDFTHVAAAVEQLGNYAKSLEAERNKLQAFKDWTHQFLDTHGVPHHPPGTHGAAGCRIGDRMDWLMAERVRLQAALKHIERLTTEREQLQRLNESLAERVAKQAECLSRKAERTVTDGQ